MDEFLKTHHYENDFKSIINEGYYDKYNYKSSQNNTMTELLNYMRLQKGYLCIGIHDMRIVSFCFVNYESDIGIIHSVVVTKYFRNQKICSKMINFIVSFFKEKNNIRLLKLTVSADNKIAIQCYSKSGFVSYDKIYDHISNQQILKMKFVF
jgi:RimJ/RimL family protein N-acetyltransferase